jgi:hypothetical protein
VRKLLVLIVILAFFAPVLRPLAHSAVTTKVCALKGKTCAMHGHSCRHDAAKGASHSSHHEHEMEPHHNSDAKQGGPVIKCGCGKDDTAGVINIQEDPFVIGRLTMPLDPASGVLKAETLLHETDPFLPIVQKPPIA